MEWEYDDVLYIDGEKRQCSIRTIGDMRDVLFSKVEEPDDTPLYYMYRNAVSKKDEYVYSNHKIRYDITIMLPKLLGMEFNKTYGHYHPFNGKKTYPEIYEVLKGRAYYLLQKKVGEEIERAIMVIANEGDKVIIPPNYGHVTINPTKENLIMANLVYDDFKSDYLPYKEKNGAIYYINNDGTYVPNKKYKKIPPLEIKGANYDKKNTIYDLFIKNPEEFEFLKRPELLGRFEFF